MTLQAFAAIAWPIVLGLLAVGAVLFIKITRRRQGTRNPSMTDAVPVRPLSDEDARRMARRYAYAAAAILAALVAGAIVVATES